MHTSEVADHDSLCTSSGDTTSTLLPLPLRELLSEDFRELSKEDLLEEAKEVFHFLSILPEEYRNF